MDIQLIIKEYDISLDTLYTYKYIWTNIHDGHMSLYNVITYILYSSVIVHYCILCSWLHLFPFISDSILNGDLYSSLSLKNKCLDTICKKNCQFTTLCNNREPILCHTNSVTVLLLLIYFIKSLYNVMYNMLMLI